MKKRLCLVNMRANAALEEKGSADFPGFRPPPLYELVAHVLVNWLTAEPDGKIGLCKIGAFDGDERSRYSSVPFLFLVLRSKHSDHLV